MILIMRTALRAFVPANRVGRFRIMVSSGVALNSEMYAGARAPEKTVSDHEPSANARHRTGWRDEERIEGKRASGERKKIRVRYIPLAKEKDILASDESN